MHAFIKKNMVMVIALLAAAITSIIIPPDRAYLGYFDLKTLTCLFCVLAVVCALKNINFFYMLARKVVKCFKNARMSILALVYITFIGSMLIANDMALLTFLPLGYLVLTTTGKQRYMAFTFVMQNIAANLGGMLTPFGNPQNLYLYTFFNIPTGEFMGIMAPPFAVSIALLTVCCLFVRPEPMEIEDEPIRLPTGRTVLSQTNQVPVPDSIQQTGVCHHDLQFFIPPAILRQRNGHRQPVVLHPCPGLSISRHPSFEHRLPVTVTDRQTEYPVQSHIIYQHT